MFFKNYVYNLIFTISNILFPIVTFPFASRVIGPVGIGFSQFVISFSQYFSLLSALGISIYGVREIAKVKHDTHLSSKILSELTLILFFSSVFFSIFYLYLVLNYDFFLDSRLTYSIAVVNVIFTFLNIDWFYMGRSMFKTIAIRSLLIKGISIIALFFFVKSKSDVSLYIAILVFSTIGNNFLNVLISRKEFVFSFDFNRIRRHLIPLFIVFSTTIGTTIYTTLDTVFLGFIGNKESVGFYTAAVKISRLSIPILTSFGTVLLPNIVAYYKEENHVKIVDSLAFSFSFITIISIPMCVGTLIYTADIIYIFSGPQFSESVIPTKILSVLPILIGYGYLYCFQILIPSGKEKYVMYSVLIGMITAIVLNLTLVEKYLSVGTAFSTVLAEMFVTGMYIYYSRKIRYYVINISIVLQTLLSTVIFIPIFLVYKYGFHSSIGLILSICSSVVAYIVIQLCIFKNEVIKKVFDYVNTFVVGLAK